MVISAPGAQASRSQLSVLEDPAQLLSVDPALQNTTLDEIKSLDADVVKIPILWRSIAPETPGGDLTNPGAYPPGAWSVTDTAVNGALARGMRVWLMISVPAPRWAVAKESKPGPGAYKPDPEAYGDFAEAVGRRYPGVTMFSGVNEPNISRFLQPQLRKGVAVSAIHYREMYREMYDGLVASGHARDTIMFGELLPRGGEVTRIAPLMWLRDFFCINKKGRKLSGRAARQRSCAGFRPIKTSGFAYHPYTVPIGPMARETKADNATIFYLKRIERVLDQASKQRRLNRKRIKIYSSEFGFQSDPPDINFTRIAKIPGFLNISEYLSYKDPRVATYSQYQIVDDLGLAGFQSGLRFVDGTIKPGVYQAYRFPVNVFKSRGNRVVVWGALRASSSGSRTINIQIKQGGSYVTVATATLSGPSRYFEKSISLPDANSKTFRLESDGLTSRSSKPRALVRAATD
ncbi:MAG: hypothetical protein WAP37_03975 [Solirubrobacterales bacterium]